MCLFVHGGIGVRGRRPRAHSPTPTMPPPTNEVDEGFYMRRSLMLPSYIANWIGVRGRRPRAHSPTPTMPPPTNEVDEGCCPHIATKKGLVN